MHPFYKNGLIILCTVVCIFSISKTSAQTPLYFKGTGTSTNTIPMNLAATRCQQLYLPGDFNAVPISGYITKIYMRNFVAGTSGTYSDLKIGFIQNTLTAFPDVNYLNGMTLALSSPSMTIIGNPTALGWYEIPLQIPFLYDNSKTLIVEISYTAKTGGMSGPTSNAGTGINKRLSNINNATATTGNLSNLWGDFGMDVISAGPCATPPTAGAAIVSNTNPICSGASVSVNLSGNSNGSGQTYYWQSSNTLSGGYSTISAPSDFSNLNVNPTATTFYRAVVTCSNVSDTSAPVEVKVKQPLSGTYTINSSAATNILTGGNNFTSFTDAASYLTCGVSGPVTIDVQPGVGPYAEQVTIPVIPGSSATNPVTINGNNQTIQATPLTASRAIIRLDGADYVTINALNISVVGTTTFGWGIHLTNGADHNTIAGCTIDISLAVSTTQSNTAGIVASGSTTSVTTDGSASFNTFSQNIIRGGYTGIIINGATGALNASDNLIIKNTIQDFYATGIELTDNNNTTISDNNIHRTNRVDVTTFAGIELGSGNKNCKVDANRIHDTHNAATTQSGAAYGVYANADDAPAGSENKVTNNLVYNFNSLTGIQYGLYNSGSDSVFYYHNTIVFDNGAATAGNTRGFYQTTLAMGIRLKNNIFYISRSGTGTKHAIYFNTTTSTIISNRNDLYVNATGSTVGVGSFSTTNSATLTDWQGANGGVYDQQSLALDPVFTNPGSAEYKPTTVALNNIGENVGVASDIVGVSRGANPDPGAYEFDLPGCSNPPTTGTVVLSATRACPGVSFTIDLTGNSTGNGQTYQLQTSPDSLNWSPSGSPQSITTFTASQSVTTYYRVALTCSGGTTVFTAGKKVTTPGLESGTFTINSGLPTGGTNFQTFADAVDFIKCGINGPVIFNVKAGSGPYNEQVIIHSIPGSSATNKITINGNGTTVQYLSVSSLERAVIKLDGTDYVTIDSLQVIAQGMATTDYGYGIHLVDDADHNTISKCTIAATTTPATAASTNFAGIVITASSATSPVGTGSSLCDDNTITGNTVTGGYVGISVNSNGSANMINDNKILNNVVTDFYTFGIHINGNNNGTVNGNNISRPTRNSVTTFYGISLTGISYNSKISNNKIHDPMGGNLAGTTASYGLRLSACDATVGNENIFSNNMIYNFNGGTGVQNGILSNSSDNVKFYHNSILLNDQSASCACAARGIYLETTTLSGLDVKNNIVVISRGGTGDKQGIFSEPTSVAGYTIDYNDYFITGSGILETGHVGTTGYTSLPLWQATGKDLHSLDVDPLYIASDNLHLQPNSPLDDKGNGVAAVITDIDGDSRDLTTPEIGADELPLTGGLDMKASALVSPAVTSGCYNVETIIVKVKNNSNSLINFATNPVSVTVNVTGAVTTSLAANIGSGSLAGGATMDVAMTSPATLDMSAPGTYNFTAQTILTGDINTANDIMPVTSRTSTQLTAGSISTSLNSFCNSGTPTLTNTGANGYSSINWQQSTTTLTGFADIPGATTGSYTPAVPLTETKYYMLVASCGVKKESSAELEIVINKPLVVSTTLGARCGAGIVNLAATANAGASVVWYQNATGGSVLATGSPFTPNITGNTVYYVSATTGQGNAVGGRATPTPAETGFTGVNYGLVFNATQAFTLNTVDVYCTGATGSIVVQLLNSAGTILQTSPTITIPAGTGTTFATGATPTTITLNFDIPIGTDYKLKTLTHTAAPIIRDNPITGIFTYPVPIGPFGNITSGWLSGAVNANTYYYFYNWQVSSGCESARTAVNARIDDCPPFVFNGNGNWDNPANWSNNTVPPSPLPAGYEIVVDPSSGSCILNVPYVVGAGGKLTVKADKSFVVQGNLSIQ